MEASRTAAAKNRLFLKKNQQLRYSLAPILFLLQFLGLSVRRFPPDSGPMIAKYAVPAAGLATLINDLGVHIVSTYWNYDFVWQKVQTASKLKRYLQNKQSMIDAVDQIIKYKTAILFPVILKD